MLKKALFRNLVNCNSINLKTKTIINFNKKYFSIYNSNKEKKLAQFFKLHSINNLKEDQIFDKSDFPDVSVLNTVDDEIDKVDLMNKILKKRLFEEERNIKTFFRGNSDRDSIRITENLIEKLRLKKEFIFSQEYKKKEVLNEYGNYDKYFENYKIVSEKKPDLEDDGSLKWEQKYLELQEKYNNPRSRVKNEKIRRKQLQKMIEDLNNYGMEFNFQDYLNFKDQFDEPDYSSTNPRDIRENHLENVDVDLLQEINDKKIDYKSAKENMFGVTVKDQITEENRIRPGDQDYKEIKPVFLNQDINYNPLRDKDGNPYQTVNLVTGPEDTPIEYNTREEVKKARNTKNKIEEIKRLTLNDQGKTEEEESPITKNQFKDAMARLINLKLFKIQFN